MASQPASPRSTLVPRLEILAAAALFSTGGAAIKATGLSAWQVAGFRSAVAAVALLLFLPDTRRFWHPRALLVGAAYGATMVLFVTGNKLTTAANTIFLQSTGALYLLLLGPLVLREPLRRRDALYGLALAVGLALFFVGTDAAGATAPDPRRGNLIAAASGLCWGLTVFGLRWVGRAQGPDSVPPLSAVVAGNLLAALVCLPNAFPVAGSTRMDWIVVLYLGLIQISLAYVFVTRGVQRLAALEVSLLLLPEPVLSAVWAWLVHGERPGPWSIAGSSLILLATLTHLLRGVRSHISTRDVEM